MISRNIAFCFVFERRWFSSFLLQRNTTMDAATEVGEPLTFRLKLRFGLHGLFIRVLAIMYRLAIWGGRCPLIWTSTSPGPMFCARRLFESCALRGPEDDDITSFIQAGLRTLHNTLAKTLNRTDHTPQSTVICDILCMNNAVRSMYLLDLQVGKRKSSLHYLPKLTASVEQVGECPTPVAQSLIAGQDVNMARSTWLDIDHRMTSIISPTSTFRRTGDVHAANPDMHLAGGETQSWMLRDDLR